MARVPIPVVGPSYQSRELALSAQVTKNLYPSIDPEAKSIASLHAFPGLKSWATTKTAIDRGMHQINHAHLYKVSGDTLYSVDSSGTATSIGTITGTGRCDFASDPTYLVITTGGTSYAYNRTTNTLTPIGDTDLVNPTTVDFLNTFFIFDQNDGTEGRFVTSAASDPTTISALDYAETESYPDDILRIIVHQQLVHFFGTETIEPWWNSGSGNPPFDRVQGAIQPYGVVGPWAAQSDGDVIFFVDNKRQARLLSGTETQPFGNNALGKAWAEYSTVSDAEVMVYTLEEQRFVQINFPTEDKTWVFHEPSRSWFQLSSGVENTRHFGSSYAYCYDKHLVADYANGNIYELDFDTFTDNSTTVQRQRTTAAIHGGLFKAPGRLLFFDKVEFDLRVGVGLTTGQGSDPQLMVRYSDDGGHTWSAQEFYPLGAGGDYLRKIELFDQGSAYSRIYELTYSEPTDFAIIAGWADISVGV